MLQQGGGGGIAQAVVFVHGFRHLSRIQLGQVCGHGLFQRSAAFAPGFLLGLPQGLGRLGSVPEQHLPRRGEVDLFQRRIPPLGQQVKGGDGVDLVVPILNTGGLAHIRRVYVQDIAPDTELPRPVHLAAAHIPGGKQPGNQLLPVIDGAGFQGQGVGQKVLPGDGVLQKGFCRGADGLQPPPRQLSQDRQAAVFVLPSGALHRAQHQVPWGEHRRVQPKGVQVLSQAGGLSFAWGHNAQHTAQVLG